ncbi:RibD domain-containing protein [Kribbella antiqua]|uniref:RibD domain-containing protein n=1 Tax=Kribbella antiqua TaxID=2512217 RepID=A0A4R2IYR9_9ACTN|nr:dihydrofolate reductase family protein [Kribbella antiqua]TCO51073.1 RibD domain-containing protein [Kribbella antiqua]
MFSSRRLPAVPGANLHFVTGDVRPVHQAMLEAAAGKNVFIAGGGALATAFAEAGLLDRITIGIAPVLLSTGKPLYTGRLTASQLTLANVKRLGQLVYLTSNLT